MNSSFYVALALLVAVTIADDSRSKKEAIYNPYGQIADANKYLATAGHNNYNNYQLLPHNNNYQQAAYPAYNQQYHQRQQPYQRGYPYNGDVATGYNRYNAYPYIGYQQYSGFQQYPYTGDQRYPYNGNQQYPYISNQQHGAYQQQYPYGYQTAYGYRHDPLGYNNYPVVRQAPAYPSSGAQPLNPPVPHPFYHVQGTYYPTTLEVNKPPAATNVTVDPTKP